MFEAKTETGYPSGLKTVEEVAVAVRMRPDRIRHFTDCGCIPHYRIDGEPFFRVVEVKKWVAENAMQIMEGSPVQEKVTILLDANRISNIWSVPETIRAIWGLRDITNEQQRCGVYFLCQGGEVVYIGQHERGSEKEFDSTFFLPWPQSELNAMESALIRALQPKYNGRDTLGRMATPRYNTKDDQKMLRQVFQIQERQNVA